MSDGFGPISPCRIKSVFCIESDHRRIPTACYSIQGEEWGLVVGHHDGSLYQYTLHASGVPIGDVNRKVIALAMANSSLVVADTAGYISLFRHGYVYDRIQGQTSISQLCIEDLFASNYNIAAANSDILILFGGTFSKIQIKMPCIIRSMIAFNYSSEVGSELRIAKCLALSFMMTDDVFILGNGAKLGSLKAPIPFISMCSGTFLECQHQDQKGTRGDDLAIISEQGEIYIYNNKQFHHWASIGYCCEAIYQCKAPKDLDTPDAILCIGHFNGWKIVHQGKIILHHPGDDSWIHSSSVFHGKNYSIISCLSRNNVVQSYEIEWLTYTK